MKLGLRIQLVRSKLICQLRLKSTYTVWMTNGPLTKLTKSHLTSVMAFLRLTTGEFSSSEMPSIELDSLERDRLPWAINGIDKRHSSDSGDALTRSTWVASRYWSQARRWSSTRLSLARNRALTSHISERGEAKEKAWRTDCHALRFRDYPLEYTRRVALPDERVHFWLLPSVKRSMSTRCLIRSQFDAEAWNHHDQLR